MKKIIEICPSPLNPTKIEVRGKHIREALEQTLDSKVCLGDGQGPVFGGKYLGRLHISGGLVETENGEIKRILVGRNELEEEKFYSIATSDYLQRGTGFSSLGWNRNHVYHPELIREGILRYLREHPKAGGVLRCVG